MNYKLATSTWDDMEIKAIHEVIESDHYTMGPRVENYERNFADFFGANFAVMTSSGSTANLLAVAALFFSKKYFLNRGDEVIVPAVSWSTTYFPLQQYGLKLKFVDIDLETLNYDLIELKSAVSDSTKAIFAVNLLGNPNDFSQIKKIIGDRDLILIEDNCESLGSQFENKFTGSFGLMGTFSSFFSHHISTMEGGMVITDDEELYHILLCLRAHGWTRNLPRENHVSNKSEDLFTESFRFVLPGYNVRPLEMSGAIGIEQLKKLPKLLTQRRNNAEYFLQEFSSDDRFILQKETGVSSWFGFSLILREGERKTLINLLDEHKIETRPIVTGNFTKNTVMQHFDYQIHNNLINADIIDSQGFFLGNSHEDLTEQINFLKKVLNLF